MRYYYSIIKGQQTGRYGKLISLDPNVPGYTPSKLLILCIIQNKILILQSLIQENV